MSGYTPGPWIWTVDRSDQCETLRQSGTGEVVISSQADINDYGLSVNPWMDVSYEDARLIAAAPDLLEVVQAMARFDGRNNNSFLKEMAKAAIAKATEAAS